MSGMVPLRPEIQSYREFLESKRISLRETGFSVPESALNPKLFPFQRAIVSWALRLGKAAIFSECGTGKTPMQLEWANRVVERVGPVVILRAAGRGASDRLRGPQVWNRGNAGI